MEPQPRVTRSFGSRLGREMLTNAPMLAVIMYSVNAVRTLTVRPDPPLSETLAKDVVLCLLGGILYAVLSASLGWLHDWWRGTSPKSRE